MKHAPDALVHAKQTLAFGSSQSGRFLRTFLYNGLNGDEKGRQVYDAVWMHIAGAAALDVNARAATPTSLTMYEITRFPYANQATRDPISGRTEGLLENDRARAFQPKTFFTNTSVEYWGGGRSAALVHTAPDGKSDLHSADNTRVYYLTGAQHGPARFPTTIGNGQQPDNPLEYWWTMRALMSGMEKWLRDGTAPPPSRYPRCRTARSSPADHGRVSCDSWRPVTDDRRTASARRQTDPVPRARRSMPTATSAPASAPRSRSCRLRPTPAGTSAMRPTGGTRLLVSLLGSRIPLPEDRGRGGGVTRPAQADRRSAILRATRYLTSAQARGRRAWSRSGYLLDRGRRAGDAPDGSSSGTRRSVTASDARDPISARSFARDYVKHATIRGAYILVNCFNLTHSA